ncbi:predicted protein, partial [Nematostella vectensis]
WSKWKPWTACSKCGVPGVRMRNRTCQKPGSPRQAIGCVGKERETEACFESCPTEQVEWSKWKPWTACSKCGVPGVRMRNRTCQKPGSPRQAIGCVGKERETEAC